jgi:hypothetical protein
MIPNNIKSRTGKIASLPEIVREELNFRLIDGAKGPELLPWLNSLPSVRDVLERQFGGRDINHQNLSAWRAGGFRDWMFRREILMATLEAKARSAAASAPLKGEQTNSPENHRKPSEGDSPLPAGEGRGEGEPSNDPSLDVFGLPPCRWGRYF